MNTTSRILLVILVASICGAAGYAYHHGQLKQVEVLKQFSAVEAHLAANNRQKARAADRVVQQIDYDVYEHRNQARDVAILHLCQQIKSRTQSLTDTLLSLRQQLRNASGNNHRYAEALVSLSPALVSLSPDATTQLAAHLDSYVRYIRQFTPTASLLTQTEAAPGSVNKFGSFYFEKTPLTAALASLTRLEALVRDYEAIYLRNLSEKVGSSYCCFDKIEALAVPGTNIVAPGAVYKAQLFLAKSVSGIFSSRMSTNDKAVRKSLDGQGIIEFRVPPLRLGQPDTVLAQWQGMIWAELYPTDTTWQIEVPYYIVKRPTP
jgi:hypothetical protein